MAILSTTALPALGSALGITGLSFAGIGVAIGIATIKIILILEAAKLLSGILFDLTSAAADLSPEMQEAANQLGFFGRITETAKILYEGFAGAIRDVQAFAEET